MPQLLKRDLLIAARRISWLNPPVFLAVILSLAAIALKGELATSPLLVPALLWAGLLLACQIGTELVFSEDYQDGSLEQLLIQKSTYRPLALRLLAQALIVALPLCLTAPLLGLLMGLPTEALPALLMTLPFGTLSLVLLGCFGGALALRRGSLLGGVLVLPLALPVLLFAVGAVDAALAGLSWWGSVARLVLLTSMLGAFAPLITAQILRLHLE